MIRQKCALTIIEIIFVITIIGIISAIIAPSFQDNSLIKAANQVAKHIRYTQHLALIDDNFDPTNRYWYKGRWQLQFSKDAWTNYQYVYNIYADDSSYTGSPNKSEMAKNPLNPKQYLSGGYSGSSHYTDERATKSMNLTQTYGIEDIKFKNCGSRAKRVAFDYLGRPIYGNLKTSNKSYSRLLQTTCHIWLCKEISCSEKIVIAIEPESGYVHILPN